MDIYKFGSVAQSVARLLCNWKVPGSNSAEGKVLFSKYLELSLIRTSTGAKLVANFGR